MQDELVFDFLISTLRFLLCWDNKLCHNNHLENTLPSVFKKACVTLSKHGRDCVQKLVVKEQRTCVLDLGGQ